MTLLGTDALTDVGNYLLSVNVLCFSDLSVSIKKCTQICGWRNWRKGVSFFNLRVEIGVVVKQTQGIECAFVEWIDVAEDNDAFRTTSPDGWNFGFHWRPWIYWLADYFFLEKVSVNNKLENRNLSCGIERLAVSVLSKARFVLNCFYLLPWIWKQ